MTFDDFLAQILNLGICMDDSRNPKKLKKTEKNKLSYNNRYNYPPAGISWYGGALVLAQNWDGGGMSGGNCWGDSADHFSPGESEPSWEEYDKILLHFDENMGILKYKVLWAKTETNSHELHEYYGNTRITNFRYIDLKTMHEFLFPDTK